MISTLFIIYSQKKILQQSAQEFSLKNWFG